MTENTRDPAACRTPSLVGRMSRRIVRHDLLGLALAIMLLGGLSAGLAELEITSDNRNFFGPDNHQIEAVRALEDAYGGADTVLFALVSEDNAFTPATLATLRAFTEDAWQLPYVLSVQSLATHVHSQAEGDEIVIEPLLPEAPALSETETARIREIALSSPELVNRLVSEDGRALAIQVNLMLPGGEGDFVVEAGEAAKRMKADWQARAPDLDILLSGGVMAALTFTEATRRDLVTLIPIAFVVVTVLMITGLGTLAGWFGALLVTLGGTIATMGFAGWTGIELLPATATSPLSVMVLLAASCVHLVLTWARHQAAGADRTAAAIAAYEENLAPVAVTNLTTAVGFLCLNFSSAPPLAEMGNMIAFGIVIGWLLTMLVLPAVFRRCPDIRLRPLRVPPEWLDAFAGATLRWRRPILAGFAALSALSLFGVAQLRFEDNALRYFDESFEFRRDSQAIERQLTGLETLQFPLRAPPGETVFSPDFLAQADRFAQWLSEQDKVAFVGTITDILKRLNQTLGGGTADAYRIADSAEANAQAMMLYEMSLPAGQDMNQMIDIDRTGTRVFAVLRDVTGNEIRALAEAAEAWLRANTPEIATEAVSVSLAFAELSQRNNRTMLWGLVTVLVLVSAILVATLRDIRLGAISLVPNVLPAILGFGLWGALWQEVNLGATVVATMTFGIVVDDTVHVLMHYQRARRRGQGIEAALRDTYRKVGTALMVTTIAILTGFTIMTLSGFAINNHVGGLSAIIVFLALVTDFVLLPALLGKERP